MKKLFDSLSFYIEYFLGTNLENIESLLIDEIIKEL